VKTRILILLFLLFCPVASASIDGDINGNTNSDASNGHSTLTGDVNNDNQIDLVDAILPLQVISGAETAEQVSLTGDVNNDGQIGLAEAIYALRTISNQHDLTPVISAIDNQETFEDTPIEISFQVNSASLDITAISSKQELVPDQNIEINGSGLIRTIKITPALDKSGETPITVKAMNGNGIKTASITHEAETSFNLTVTPIDDPPAISKIANLSIQEDTTTELISFTVSDKDTDLTSLRVFAISYEPAIVDVSGIKLGGSGQERTLQIIPRADQHGIALISVVVGDGTSLVSTSFELTVASVIDSQASYEAYLDLEENRLVKSASEEARNSDYFWPFIKDLETSGKICVPEPLGFSSPDLDGCSEPENRSRGRCRQFQITVQETEIYLAAKTAHAVWLDKTGQLPWKLKDYEEAELAMLFDKNLLFWYPNGLPGFISIADYSPSAAYTLTREFVRSDIHSTILDIIYDLRTNDQKVGFLHGSTKLGGTQEIRNLWDALTTYIVRRDDEVRVARNGSSSMAYIFAGMLRSINIPANVVYGKWNCTGDAEVEIPSAQMIIPNGDDFFTTWLKATPTEEMFPSYSFYEEEDNIEACKDHEFPQGCIGKRYPILKFIEYPSDWLFDSVCKKDSCEDYLTQLFAPYLTAEELDWAHALCSLCPE